MTLQHIVLFSFPRPLSEADAAEMRAMVASWPAEIGLMTKCRLGTDLTGERNRGYSYLLYTEFADAKTLRRYQDHPVHLRFRDWIMEHDCTPLAFDYHLDERTVLMAEPARAAGPDAAPARAAGTDAAPEVAAGTDAAPEVAAGTDAAPEVAAGTDAAPERAADTDAAPAQTAGKSS
jgi:Stress responsive A/B Barrel Domain